MTYNKENTKIRQFLDFFNNHPLFQIIIITFVVLSFTKEFIILNDDFIIYITFLSIIFVSLRMLSWLKDVFQRDRELKQMQLSIAFILELDRIKDQLYVSVFGSESFLATDHYVNDDDDESNGANNVLEIETLADELEIEIETPADEPEKRITDENDKPQQKQQK